jgi:hypothetical protein
MKSNLLGVIIDALSLARQNCSTLPRFMWQSYLPPIGPPPVLPFHQQYVFFSTSI